MESDRIWSTWNPGTKGKGKGKPKEEMPDQDDVQSAMDDADYGDDADSIDPAFKGKVEPFFIHDQSGGPGICHWLNPFDHLHSISHSWHRLWAYKGTSFEVVKACGPEAIDKGRFLKGAEGMLFILQSIPWTNLTDGNLFH